MRRLLAPALVVATSWAYAPVLGYGFLAYDDALYVTGRPEVLKGLTAHGVAWAFTNVEVGNWHPLTWLAHMLDVQLFGLNAGAQLSDRKRHNQSNWFCRVGKDDTRGEQ